MKKMDVWDPSVKAFKSMQEAVRSALTNCAPGDEFEALVRALQYNIPGQAQVRKDVMAAFQSHYSGVFTDDQLHLFGSSVMGIAFKDSDLDIYIDLPNLEPTKAARQIRIEMVRGILEASGKFARFVMFTKPRIPIVRCINIATLTQCDFNCSNGFGTLNSPIVAHLLNFDPRIRKLAIIIKYWMKIHKCSGKWRISNYAIVWMLIFYLQTLPKPIVPPIAEFQRNVPPAMHSHYNFAFDYSLPNKTENQSQLPELLLGFFKFYRVFDFTNLVICPLYGKTLRKTDVKERKVAELQRYNEILFRGSEMPMFLDSICIQDPFEIIRKIPGEIEDYDRQTIVWKIGYAAAIIECELQRSETKSMFSKLFDANGFNEFIKQPKRVKLSIVQSFSTAPIGSQCVQSTTALQSNLHPNNIVLSERRDVLLNDEERISGGAEKGKKITPTISVLQQFSQ